MVARLRLCKRSAKKGRFGSGTPFRSRLRVVQVFGQHVSPAVVKQLLIQPAGLQTELRHMCFGFRYSRSRCICRNDAAGVPTREVARLSIPSPPENPRSALAMAAAASSKLPCAPPSVAFTTFTPDSIMRLITPAGSSSEIGKPISARTFASRIKALQYNSAAPGDTDASVRAAAGLARPKSVRLERGQRRGAAQGFGELPAADHLGKRGKFVRCGVPWRGWKAKQPDPFESGCSNSHIVSA